MRKILRFVWPNIVEKRSRPMEFVDSDSVIFGLMTEQ